ncbi:hypothetical protein QNH46_05785 [Paenibacillus woosongensis]|uniref:Uncharacterized protein n=1 Tax=Paenibacillus woosongensis TaxID=307580 RepID=A0AA95I5E7_9BACL|nr:DUF6809 family protein [Paenibacillus woosongensis]WHX50175.1 hypothetical protein QNH46_05785 [Paenibacillus woosongensis]
MKSMLEALFYGDIRPEEQVVPKNPDYRSISRRLSEAMELWKEKLSSEDFNQLEEMLDLRSQSESIYASNTFINGFQLGALIMMEIYTAKEDLLQDIK